MGAIESETAAATAETTRVESLETEAPENGDRETKFQPRPRAATGAPARARSAASWGAWDDRHRWGDSACEPLHGYSYGTTEKINRGN